MNLRTPLTIHLEGPAVRHNRMALQDFVLFVRQLQAGVDRVARVLLGQRVSVQPGRKPSEIKSACSLDIIEIRGGSLIITCDLPIEAQGKLFDDLGEEALTSFVQGIEAVGRKEHLLPQGYDKGVLLSLREGGKLFDHGVEKITFDLRTRRGNWAPTYTPEVHAHVISLIQEPVENRRQIEGRLLMGDFKEAGLRCRIHPPAGRAIQCTFDEAQKESVLTALTRYVRLVGEATEVEGAIQTLKIGDIEILDQEDEAETIGERGEAFFFAETDLELLAARQGVTAITDFDELLGDFWPEEENLDQFLATVREWRDEGENRSLS